jgi:L-ascorbate metabolism protein UlaG (beta-lactamase superfamily)
MTASRKKSTAPTQLTITTYQVGFGDCFLLRFDYPAPGAARHVLIDFGSTGMPPKAEADSLLLIARDIAKKCGGKLDAVVATHRHADHISGFATSKDKSGSGDVIRALKPDVVVQPWTEEPDLATNALGPADEANASAQQALTHMHAVSAKVVELIDRHPNAAPPALAERLRFVGIDNIANQSAVMNLATMGKGCYVYYGSKSGLEEILPGMKIHVLGPPTLRQSNAIRKMTARDKEQYWHLQLGRVGGDSAAAAGAALFPGHVAAKGGKLPMSARWLADRVRANRGEQLMQLVTSLDNQMNNTSVILLFESRAKKLLFPGDAQIENWQHALAEPKYQAMLADVDLYKVGHHGSLNATPRSMWQAFSKKGDAKKKDRMTALLSTMPGKHGHAEAHTEVPRATLLKELQANTALHSTHTLAAGVMYDQVVIAL